nr:15323_t:CDS:2 [Entrophospora candida]
MNFYLLSEVCLFASAEDDDLKKNDAEEQNHNAIVYKMTVPFRGLYVFKEVVRSQLPTSQINIALMRQCIPMFLLFKEMLLESLNNLHEYIMEAEMMYIPQKEGSKKVDNREVGKRGGKKKELMHFTIENANNNENLLKDFNNHQNK